MALWLFCVTTQLHLQNTSEMPLRRPCAASDAGARRAHGWRWLSSVVLMRMCFTARSWLAQECSTGAKGSIGLSCPYAKFSAFAFFSQNESKVKKYIDLSHLEILTIIPVKIISKEHFVWNSYLNGIMCALLIGFLFPPNETFCFSYCRLLE